MQLENLMEHERELAEEKRSKCQGSARIKLENLHFPFEESREPDTRQISKLKTLFSREKGCRDRDTRNHVVAVIQKQHLEAAMAAADIAPGSLCSKDGYDYPNLDFPAGYRLSCLHGQQRVLAGAKCLPPGDQRWTVDIFLADMSEDLRNALIEDYSLEKGPDDGEFYRKIREYQGYQGRENHYLERKWWARLHAMHENSARGLKRILANPLYRKAFDVQLEIPGLGSGMRLSTSQKMLAMRCDEQILNYLNYTREVWYRFLRGDKVALRKVDRRTVKALELTAPGACRADREALYERISKGELFSAFNDQTRQTIWEEILSASKDCLIPSLYTFWEDVNYLKGPSDCIRLLVPLSAQETLSAAVIRAFSDVNQEPDQCVIQTLENRFVSQPGTRSDRVELGCRQLWLSAMRHFHEIPTLPKRKNKALLAKPVTRTNENVVREFAALAFRLGFETPPIRDLIHQSPDRELARANLMQARPPRQYEYDAVNFEHFIEQMMKFYAAARERTVQTPDDTKSTEEFQLPRRCGLPEADRHQNDVSSIYLHGISTADTEDDDEISSLFVRRSVYFAFFDRPRYEIKRVTTSSLENRVESFSQSIARHLSQTESMEGVVLEKEETGFETEHQPELDQYHRVQHITTSSLENEVESFSQSIARHLSQTESMEGVVMEQEETGFETEHQPELDQYQMITKRFSESSQEQANIQPERNSLEKQYSQVQHNFEIVEEEQKKLQEGRALLEKQQSQLTQELKFLEEERTNISEDRIVLEQHQSELQQSFKQQQEDRALQQSQLTQELKSLEEERTKIREDRILLEQHHSELQQSFEQQQEDRALLEKQQSQFIQESKSLEKERINISEDRIVLKQHQSELQQSFKQQQEDRALLEKQQSQFIQESKSLEEERTKIREDRIVLEQYQSELQQSMQQAEVEENRAQAQPKFQSKQKGLWREQKMRVRKHAALEYQQHKETSERIREEIEPNLGEEMEVDKTQENSQETDVDKGEPAPAKPQENSQETPLLRSILNRRIDSKGPRHSRKQEKRVTQFELEKVL